MEELKLDVQIRNEVGTRGSREIRKNNFIPAVVYGESQKPTVVKIDRGTFERIERQHKGESIVLHLNVLDGDKKLKDYSTIIKEIQLDSVTDKILHVDFHRISLTKELQVQVPIVVKGEAVGVKKDAGSLDQHLWELEVVCLPTKIPQNIEVNVAQLGLNESIHVKDLFLPEGVKTKHDPEGIVVTVVPPRKEELEAAEVAEGPEEPEVIREKKKEESAEGATATDKSKAAEKPKEAKAKEAKAEEK
ncbi:MAG: 50S ribosomal protein L25 [Candidatus Omnitrophota bacterium]